MDAYWMDIHPLGTLTVGSSLRPYPHISDSGILGSPLPNSWNRGWSADAASLLTRSRLYFGIKNKAARTKTQLTRAPRMPPTITPRSLSEPELDVFACEAE